MLAVRAFYRAAGYSLPAMGGAGGTGRPSQGAMLPQADVVFVPTLPAVVLSSSLVLGQPPGRPALVLGSGRLRAVMQLTVAQGALIRPGDPGALYVTAAGGATARVAASVTAVRATQSGFTAMLTPRERLRWALLRAKVSGSIVIADTRTPVLAVPVAALYATADGQVLVTVVKHSRRIDVPVQVGAEIGGYVPVRPVRGALAAGERVLVGQ